MTPHPLEHALDYRFHRPELLAEALSHRSVGRVNYERLEFLGDGLVNFVVASELFDRYPDENEGALSRLRAALVRESTLADIANGLDLGRHLVLGGGEQKSGGFRRKSILADVVESIVGAVFIDSDFETARALVLRLYGDRFRHLPSAESLKDPKTRLQELLQKHGHALPKYEVVSKSGEDHALSFVVRCTLPSQGLAVEKEDSSRRRAEQAAAAEILAHQSAWLTEAEMKR